MTPPPLATREMAREARFAPVWSEELNKVFADVAPYYDRANDIATLGLCDGIRRGFMETIQVKPHMRVLDVCAGTNANGIALLQREPTLEVHAIDRSEAMQEVGSQRAQAKGVYIHSHIGDVHTLPFPDNHFDLITLQFASRHLGVRRGLQRDPSCAQTGRPFPPLRYAAAGESGGRARLLRVPAVLSRIHRVSSAPVRRR